MMLVSVSMDIMKSFFSLPVLTSLNCCMLLVKPQRGMEYDIILRDQLLSHFIADAPIPEDQYLAGFTSNMIHSVFYSSISFPSFQAPSSLLEALEAHLASLEAAKKGATTPTSTK